MAQTFTYQEINTNGLVQTKLGNGFTAESVEERFEIIRDYVKDLEDKLTKAEERADSNENDAGLFRTLRDELKTNIAKAETAYNDTVKEAKKDIGKRLAEAKKSVDNSKAEAENIISDANLEADAIRAKANESVVEANNEASRIIDKAKAEAQSISSKAELAYNTKLGEAKVNSDSIISNAKEEANTLLQTAEAESEQLLKKAREEADNITSTASTEAGKVIEQAKLLDKANKETRAKLINAINVSVNEAVTLFSDSNILLNQLKEDALGQLALDESEGETEKSEAQSESQAVIHSEAMTPEQEKALQVSAETQNEMNQAIAEAVTRDNDKGGLDQAKSFLNTLG